MRTAASAAAAKLRMKSKNLGDCPAKSPLSVKNARAPIASPRDSVRRIMEHFGSFRLRNVHGSGMMRLGVNVSPSNGGTVRSGNFSPFVGSISGANGGDTAAPALSDQ